jgi:hypothetical protein
MIRVVHPGSGSRILHFYPSGSRIQGPKRHRIRIRNPNLVIDLGIEIVLPMLSLVFSYFWLLSCLPLLSFSFPLHTVYSSTLVVPLISNDQLPRR